VTRVGDRRVGRHGRGEDMGAPGMRRTKAFKRGRVLSIVVAGFAGYVIGGWNGAFPHSTALSAAQAVALRFPQDLDDGSTTASATVAAATAATVATATKPMLSNAQFALLSPQPMVPQASDQSAPPQQAAPQPPQAPLHLASAEEMTIVPPPAARPSPAKPAVAAAPVRRVNERPGFVLNDAQIASIKDRLHLTSDQEEMWPAVEAALRNLAYSRAREARRHGTPVNTQIAAADPNSPDVQDLKSAAIPLIMSFNSEQKDEVRNLAHVMGLDQLANQF
jgi:hypothetical protein